MLVNGEIGSGKTSLISYIFTKHLTETGSEIPSKSFVYSIDSFSGAEYTVNFMKCFCIQMCQQNSFPSLVLKIDEIFSEDDPTQLGKIFAQILQLWAENNPGHKFHVIIDGVDMLCDQNGLPDESFSWMPMDTPSCFNFIFSARSSSNTSSVLSRIANSRHFVNMVKLHQFTLESLDVLVKLPKKFDLLFFWHR